MLRWRAFFFVLLLILSLPIRAGAATSVHCDVSPVVAGAVVAGDPYAASARHNDVPHGLPVAAIQRMLHHDGSGTMRHGHAGSQCGLCVPCYVGAAAPVSAVTQPGHAVAIQRIGHPVSDAATNFLTGGIDRPPRLFLT